MKIKFNDQTVIVTTHPENSELYCLNDLHRASGAGDNKAPNRLLRQKPNLASVNFSPEGTRATYKYADEKTVYKYAAWVDDDFYDAVFEAFKHAANGEGDKAVEVAQSVVDVHATMLIKKPRHRIRQYFDGMGIQEAVEAFLKAMSGNTKATYEDRVRTVQSLRMVVNEQYDSIHARERDKAMQCEISLKKIAEYERYQARLEAAKPS